jgi:hypothetical protein
MDLTQKITRDINQFKNVPSSQVSGTSTLTSGETSSWSISSIFTPYTIGIVVIILLMFGSWFAWDWYKTHHKTSESTQSQTPIGGSTVKPVTEKSTTSTPTSTIPPVVTTMSPIQYAKYQKDQKALETALGSSNAGGSGGGGEPQPDDAAAGVGKTGWCYIGEDQGYGVCASVQQNDKCMSGQVYPTESDCRQK